MTAFFWYSISWSWNQSRMHNRNHHYTRPQTQNWTIWALILSLGRSQIWNSWDLEKDKPNSERKSRTFSEEVQIDSGQSRFKKAQLISPAPLRCTFVFRGTSLLFLSIKTSFNLVFFLLFWEFKKISLTWIYYSSSTLEYIWYG